MCCHGNVGRDCAYVLHGLCSCASRCERALGYFFGPSTQVQLSLEGCVVHGPKSTKCSGIHPGFDAPVVLQRQVTRLMG